MRGMRERGMLAVIYLTNILMAGIEYTEYTTERSLDSGFISLSSNVHNIFEFEMPSLLVLYSRTKMLKLIRIAKHSLKRLLDAFVPTIMNNT